MPLLSTEHVRSPEHYEPARADSRRRLAERKRDRRVALGELITLVFENHATICGVVEEALRSEHIVDAERLTAEVEAFAKLVPEAGELCAISVCEIADPAEFSRRNTELEGITRAVRLAIGDDVVEPDDEHAGDLTVTGLGYLRFRLDDDRRRRFKDPAVDVLFQVLHPAYRAQTTLNPAQRMELATGL